MKDYKNLHSKTIYDFTDDAKLIEDITVIGKAAYLAAVKKNPVINAYHLIEFAEHTKNDELKSAVEKEYKDELSAVDNE